MKKIFAASMSGLLVVALLASAVFFYSAFEPTRVSAVDVSDEVIVTLNVDAGISITSPSNTTMSRNLGVSVNTAIGTTTWNVKTNNAAGYTLAVKATSTPAMLSGSNSITDYQTGSPDTWSVSASDARFGYSAYGTDVPTGTWGSFSNCGVHVANASGLYKGFTTSNVTIATRSATTTTSGVDSSVCYAVEQNGIYIPSGTYTATIVATATTL